MKKCILLVSICMIFLMGISQITFQDRIEFELKDGYSNEQIHLFGANGFIISSKNDVTDDELQEWKFEKISSYLEIDQAVSVSLNEDFLPKGSCKNEDRLFNLYMDRKGNFSLISVEASTMELTKVAGTFPKKFHFNQMAVLGDYAFITGSIKKEPMMCVLDWNSGKYKMNPIIISTVKSKKITIRNIQILDRSNDLFVFVDAKINRKHSDTYVFHYSDNGSLKNIINITSKDGMTLMDVSASKLDDQKYIFTGTYSPKNAFVSEGIFFCQTENNNVSYIKYYKYANLKKFLNYLPKKEHIKILKKKAKKAKKGEEFNISYRLATHEIIPTEDGFLFLGEAFYPTYRSYTYTTSTFVNGRMSVTTHTQTVFDGYQYTHAMLCKFDMEGNMVWDQIFEMYGSYKPFYVKKFISIMGDNYNPIKLVFTSYHRLMTKTIDQNGNEIDRDVSFDLKLNNQGEEVKYTNSDINYWYDNYFIAYGNQVFKKEDGQTIFDKNKKVYFINKIKFE